MSQVWEKWLAFSPDPQYLTIYARYDPGMVVRRHGHFSPHVVFVLEGEVSFGEHRCPAGTHIELPLGAAFGPVVAGPEGAVMFEVMMGDPRSWGDEPEAYEAALAAQGAEALPDPPLEFPAGSPTCVRTGPAPVRPTPEHSAPDLRFESPQVQLSGDPTSLFQPFDGPVEEGRMRLHWGFRSSGSGSRP